MTARWLVVALCVGACDHDVDGFAGQGDGVDEDPQRAVPSAATTPARRLATVALDAPPVDATWALSAPARVLALSAARGQVDVVAPCDSGGWCVTGSFFVGVDPRRLAAARVGGGEVLLAQADERTVMLLEGDAVDPKRLRFPVAVLRSQVALVDLAVTDWNGDGDDDLVVASADRVTVVTELERALGADPEHAPALAATEVVAGVRIVDVAAQPNGAIAWLVDDGAIVGLAELGVDAPAITWMSLQRRAERLLGLACDGVFATDGGRAAPLAIATDGRTWRPTPWQHAQRLWAGDATTAWRDDEGDLYESGSCSAGARRFELGDGLELGDTLAWWRDDARVLVAAVQGDTLAIYERREALR